MSLGKLKGGGDRDQITTAVARDVRYPHADLTLLAVAEGVAEDMRREGGFDDAQVEWALWSYAFQARVRGPAVQV